MPTNKDLESSIAAAAETLDVDVPDIEGASNAEMAKILKVLNTEIEAAEAEVTRIELKEKAADDSAAAALLAKNEVKEAKAKKAEKATLPEFYISKGKALTTRRGIRADGDEVTTKDFVGGIKIINAFVKSGHISKG